MSFEKGSLVYYYEEIYKILSIHEDYEDSLGFTWKHDRAILEYVCDTSGFRVISHRASDEAWIHELQEIPAMLAIALSISEEE